MPAEVVDLVVVGAGPAGLAAACEARQWGLSVMVLDEQSAVGGQIYRALDAAPASRRAALGDDYAAGAALTAAFARSGARHVGQATVWNVGRDMLVNYLQGGRSHAVQGRHIVLASGAMERPFPIPGWTLPGVMGAGAAQVLFKSAGALPTEPVVVAGCGPLLYLLASQYLQAGVRLKAVVHTTRPSDYLRASSKLAGALAGWREMRKGLRMITNLRRRRVPVYAGAEAFSIEGNERAEAIRFMHRGRNHRIESPLVLLHQGVVPNTQLSWALGGRHRWDEAQLCWLPETDADGQIEASGIFIVGDGRAIVGAKAAALQGRLAALAVAARLERMPASERDSRANQMRGELRGQLRIRPFLGALYRPPEAHRVPADTVIVCRCEEVTAGQLRGLVALGCQGPNQAKAFGRCGMGPCQGRLCGLTVTELMAGARGVPHEQVGYYRIRFPIKPVTLGDLAA
jgi:NADPH-dependent 2,4-dienoyl-CoA reductase/sulfur reductase-like enzyme